MTGPRCEFCAFRQKYDGNPRSLLGRLWRWHTRWCPGWRKYLMSLPTERQYELIIKYDLKK